MVLLNGRHCLLMMLLVDGWCDESNLPMNWKRAHHHENRIKGRLPHKLTRGGVTVGGVSPLFPAIFLPFFSEQPVVSPCWRCQCRANGRAWPSCDCPLLACPAQSSPKKDRGLPGTDRVSSNLRDHVHPQTNPPGERNLRGNKTNHAISIIYYLDSPAECSIRHNVSGRVLRRVRR